MNTLYELFKVNEDATQEEIKDAFDKIIEKANSLPQSDKIIEQVQRIKIAYGILSNPEKRKKYDEDLATKRANELLENVQVKEENNQEQESSEKYKVQKGISQIDREKLKKAIDSQVENMVENGQIPNPTPNINEKDAEKLQKSAQKEQQKQMRKDKRQARKEAELQREREIQEYGAYLENQGYKVKYPWTWLRVKRLLISLVAVIITFVILWHIPFIHNMLTELYENNFVIKTLVDIFLNIFNSIIGSIKGIFK